MKSMLKPLLSVLLIALLVACAAKQPPAQAPAPEQPTEVSEPAPEGATAYGYGEDPVIEGQAGEIDFAVNAPLERVVYFDFDSFQLRGDSQAVVEAHARFLVDNPGAAVLLEGHTDARGSREYNIALGERRGNAVQQVFVVFGIPPSRIKVVSYGEERPAAPGQNEADFGLNRRVEITY